MLVIVSLAGPATAAATGRGIPATTSPFQVQQTLTLAAQAPACPASWECLPESDAQATWGTNGYSRYSDTPCGRAPTVGAVIPYYCFQKKEMTLIRRDIPIVTTLVSVQKPSCTPGLTWCFDQGCVNMSSDTGNCGPAVKAARSETCAQMASVVCRSRNSLQSVPATGTMTGR